MFKNVIATVEEGAEKVVFRKPKTFSEFEYMPSPYSIVDDLKRDERLRSEAEVPSKSLKEQRDLNLRPEL